MLLLQIIQCVHIGNCDTSFAMVLPWKSYAVVTCLADPDAALLLLMSAVNARCLAYL